AADTPPRVTDTHDPGFRVERVDLQDGRAALRFGGQLRFRQCFASWQSVRRLARPPAAHLAFDLSGVDTLDGAATALLLELRDEVVAAGGDAAIVGAHGGVRAMLDLYGSHPPRSSLHPPPTRIGVLDQIGRETLTMLSESHGLDFIGDVALAGANAVRVPSSINWGDVPRLMERAGADSLPIVLVINFLVGLVTAFQAAVRLWDVSSGCLKTVFFGLSIALIACQRGLAARGGAEGVGRATTSAVVTSLFAIVVIDAIFTVLFNVLGR